MPFVPFCCSWSLLLVLPYYHSQWSSSAAPWKTAVQFPSYFHSSKPHLFQCIIFCFFPSTSPHPTSVPPSPHTPAIQMSQASLCLLCGCVLEQVQPLLKQPPWTCFPLLVFKNLAKPPPFLFYIQTVSKDSIIPPPTPRLQRLYTRTHTHAAATTTTSRAPICIESSGFSWGLFFVVVSPWAE